MHFGVFGRTERSFLQLCADGLSSPNSVSCDITYQRSSCCKPVIKILGARPMFLGQLPTPAPIIRTAHADRLVILFSVGLCFIICYLISRPQGCNKLDLMKGMSSHWTVSVRYMLFYTAFMSFGSIKNNDAAPLSYCNFWTFIFSVFCHIVYCRRCQHNRTYVSDKDTDWKSSQVMTFCNISSETYPDIRPSLIVQSCNVQSVNIQSSIVQSCNAQSCNFSVTGPSQVVDATKRRTSFTVLERQCRTPRRQ